MSHNLFAQAQCGTQGLNIPVPAGTSALPTDLDDKGGILGSLLTSSGFTGFLFSQGTFTHFRFPGSAETFANDINKNSVIVGSFDLVLNGQQHAFMVRSGTFSEIKLPGFPSAPAGANGINDQGDITGQFTGNGVQQGFLLHNGVLTTISFPGATGGTFPKSINNAGVIVGFYKIGNDPGHGFMWKNGVFTNIDAPNAQFTMPLKINDNGAIAGTFIDTIGTDRTFVLSNRNFFNIIQNSAGTDFMGLNNFSNVIVAELTSKNSFLVKGFCSAVF